MRVSDLYRDLDVHFTPQPFAGPVVLVGGDGEGGAPGIIDPSDYSLADFAGAVRWIDQINFTGSNLADLDTSRYTDLTDRDHDIIGDHVVTGAKNQIIGLSATDTLDKITPASDVSGGETIFISDVNGDGTVNAWNVNDNLTAGALRWSAAYNALWVNDGQPSSSAAAALRTVGSHSTQVALYVRQRSDQATDMMRVANAANSVLWRVTSDGNLRSGTYDANVTGWEATPAGKFSAWDANIRGTIYATIFQIDEVHVDTGTLIVSHDGGALLEDVWCSGTGGTITLKIEDSIVSSARHFEVGDFLYLEALGIDLEAGAAMKRHAWDINAANNDAQLITTGPTWFTVTLVARVSDHWEYTCDIEQAAAFTVRKGTPIIGHSQRKSIGGGQYDNPGYIEISANRVGAPYIRVRTIHTDEPWNVAPRTNVIVGQIAAVDTMFSETSDEASGWYGLAFSEGFDDSQNSHAVFANHGIGMYKIYQMYAADDGSGGTVTTGKLMPDGSLAFSSDLGDSAAGGFRFKATDDYLGSTWLGMAAGDVVIGDPQGSHIKWDYNGGANSQLIFTGGPLATQSTSPYTSEPGLYLTQTRLGYWDGNWWRSRIDSDGSFYFSSNHEDAPSGTGLYWDASTGKLIGRDASGTQWYADAHTGRIYAGGGDVVLDQDGVTMQAATGYSTLFWNGGPSSTAVQWGERIGIVGWRQDITSYLQHRLDLTIAGVANEVDANKQFSNSRLQLNCSFEDNHGYIYLYNDGVTSYLYTEVDRVVLKNLPTSDAGLPTGGVYNDGGTLKVA